MCDQLHMYMYMHVWPAAHVHVHACVASCTCPCTWLDCRAKITSNLVILFNRNDWQNAKLLLLLLLLLLLDPPPAKILCLQQHLSIWRCLQLIAKHIASMQHWFLQYLELLLQHHLFIPWLASIRFVYQGNEYSWTLELTKLEDF